MKNIITKDQGCDRATQDYLQEEHQKGQSTQWERELTEREKTKENEKETERGGVGRKRRCGVGLPGSFII